MQTEPGTETMGTNMHQGNTSYAALRHHLTDGEGDDDLGYSCACCGCSSCRSDLEDGDAGRAPGLRPAQPARHAVSPADARVTPP